MTAGHKRTGPHGTDNRCIAANSMTHNTTLSPSTTSRRHGMDCDLQEHTNTARNHIPGQLQPRGTKKTYEATHTRAHQVSHLPTPQAGQVENYERENNWSWRYLQNQHHQYKKAGTMEWKGFSSYCSPKQIKNASQGRLY